MDGGEAFMPGVCQRQFASPFIKALRLAAGIESGVVTAFFAVATAATSTVVGLALLGFELLVTHERLIAAVDLSALAAADTQRGLVSGVVCENAESILKTVDAVMTTCRIVGDGVLVSGELSFLPVTLEASAIAGEK